MTPAITSSAGESGFSEAFERQREGSCRRAFIMLCVGYMALAGVVATYVAIRTPNDLWTTAAGRVWLRILLLVGAAFVCGCLMLLNRRRCESRTRIMPVITVIILLMGATMLGSRLVLKNIDPMLTAWGLLDLLLLHLLACMLLPWRMSESLAPFVPLVLLWGAVALIPHSEWDVMGRAAGGVAAFAVLAPGALISGWRYKRSQEDFDRVMLGHQVRTIGDEMSRARIVHDAMFPKSLDTGHIQFEYEYVPMQEIGGDYVHVHHCRSTGRVYLTLLDVAGHGLAAALTVNRLFGELERIRAENADAEPSDVMELLNRYVNLTMAQHNLYATGACLMLDPASGELKWVNAGHPPAVIRRANGTVEDVPGTTMMLGASSYAEFDPHQRSVKLSPGDVVIAYTDGAFEARNRSGQRFGIARIRETAAFTPAPRSWTKFIATAVTKHMDGPAEDDMLLAALTFVSISVEDRSAVHKDSEFDVAVPNRPGGS